MYQPTVVVGQSMAPTLPDGQVIYVDRTYYRTHKPVAGEVVVFAHQGDVYVKRVYRGPGETVHYFGDLAGVITLVNEARQDEFRRRFATSVLLKSLRVPDDCVFVLGDNYSCSEDSRELGPIPIRELIGRARVDPDPTIGWKVEMRLPRRPPIARPAETAKNSGEWRS